MTGSRASLLDQSSFLLIFLLVAVAAVAMIYRGNIERVKYLGVYPNVTYPNGMLLLETDPFGLWLIEPGETFNSLQAGLQVPLQIPYPMRRQNRMRPAQ